MIHHLHFLPLTTLLQAAYARIWVLSCTILAHVRPRKGEEPNSTGMEAVLTGEEVINLGSIHGNAADMGAIKGPGRIEITKEELESRAGDLSRIADKGKRKDEGKVEEETTGSSPDLGVHVGVATEEEDLFVDFGTKVERTSTQLRPGSQSRPSSRPNDALKPVDRAEPVEQKVLSSEVEERVRKGSSPVSMTTHVHTVAAASSSHAGLEPTRDSRNSTPIIDTSIPRSPAPTVRISGKQTKVDKRSPALNSISTTKGLDETETGGGMATKKKEKKKRTTDVDDLFGGPVPSGKEAGVKKRKVGDRIALGDAELVAPVVEKLEAVSTPAEVSKSKLKRAPDAGKSKLKRKKKKGDDLDDIFGF
jgi:hypothetical protein